LSALPHPPEAIDEKSPAGQDVSRRSGPPVVAAQRVLDNAVTEIDMSEKQFWNFAQLQPVAEKPWITFMGRTIRVTDMPEAARLSLGFAA